MKVIVTYASKYGHAKTYARWIAEELDCEFVDISMTTSEKLQEYDVIIHGGGIYAGKISGLDQILGYYDKISDKKLVLFSCGIADPEDPADMDYVREILNKAFTQKMKENIRFFHIRGGIDYKELKFVHRAMMSMLKKMLIKKGIEHLTDTDKQILETYGDKLDFTDKSYIEQIVDYVRE